MFNQDKFIQFLEDCSFIRSRIEEIVWSSEVILAITSTFHLEELDRVSVKFPNMTQKFLYTLWLILEGTNNGEKSWVNLMRVDLENKVTSSGNLWLFLRTSFGEINRNTALELLLSDPLLGYDYSTFYSIIGTQEFNQLVREIEINIKKKVTGPVQVPQRKRGYTDKGSRRADHISTVWTQKDTIDIIIEKQKSQEKLRYDFQGLFFSFMA